MKFQIIILFSLLMQSFFFVSGEVERLLREYTQNQEMVRNIGAHYYQIIYPVQLRQHKKMGISTREIGGPPKVRKVRSSVCHCTNSSHSTTLKTFYKSYTEFFVKTYFPKPIVFSNKVSFKIL